VTSATSDSIQVVVDASSNGVGAGDIRIGSSTGAYVVGASAWTYVTPASIDSVAPARGTIGTTVVISGTGLPAGGAEIISVTLANVAVEVLGASSDTRVDVVAGAGSARTGNVVMVADSGAIISLEDGWEYTTAGLITSVTPAVGQHGTGVTIAGTNLLADGTGHTEISLAGTNVKEVISVSATEIVVVADRADAATGDVRLVAYTGGRVISSGGFAYNTEGAMLSATPSSGQHGAEITIYGVSLFGHGAGHRYGHPQRQRGCNPGAERSIRDCGGAAGRCRCR
jgi:hypothetical protein